MPPRIAKECSRAALTSSTWPTTTSHPLNILGISLIAYRQPATNVPTQSAQPVRTNVHLSNYLAPSQKRNKRGTTKIIHPKLLTQRVTNLQIHFDLSTICAISRKYFHCARSNKSTELDSASTVRTHAEWTRHFVTIDDPPFSETRDNCAHGQFPSTK